MAQPTTPPTTPPQNPHQEGIPSQTQSQQRDQRVHKAAMDAVIAQNPIPTNNPSFHLQSPLLTTSRGHRRASSDPTHTPGSSPQSSPQQRFSTEKAGVCSSPDSLASSPPPKHVAGAGAFSTPPKNQPGALSADIPPSSLSQYSSSSFLGRSGPSFSSSSGITPDIESWGLGNPLQPPLSSEASLPSRAIQRRPSAASAAPMRLLPPGQPSSTTSSSYRPPVSLLTAVENPRQSIEPTSLGEFNPISQSGTVGGPPPLSRRQPPSIGRRRARSTGDIPVRTTPSITVTLSQDQLLTLFPGVNFPEGGVNFSLNPDTNRSCATQASLIYKIPLYNLGLQTHLFVKVPQRWDGFTGAVYGQRIQAQYEHLRSSQIITPLPTVFVEREASPPILVQGEIRCLSKELLLPIQQNNPNAYKHLLENLFVKPLEYLLSKLQTPSASAAGPLDSSTALQALLCLDIKLANLGILPEGSTALEQGNQDSETISTLWNNLRLFDFHAEGLNAVHSTWANNIRMTVDFNNLKNKIALTKFLREKLTSLFPNEELANPSEEITTFFSFLQELCHCLSGQIKSDEETLALIKAMPQS